MNATREELLWEIFTVFVVSTTPTAGLRPVESMWLGADGQAKVQHQPGDYLAVFQADPSPDPGIAWDDLISHWHHGTPRPDVSAWRGSFVGLYVDLRDRRAKIIRDHLGAMDVLLFQYGADFTVGTELGAVLRHGPCRPGPDRAGLVQYAVVGFTFGGRTFVRGVRHLAPGSVTTVSHTGSRTASFWSYPYGTLEMSPDDAVDHLAELLATAADRIHRTRTGTQLIGISGGLDSRVVAATALRAGTRLHGFFFGEPDSDAGRRAAEVAATLAVPLDFPARNRTLHRRFRESVAYDPMLNLEWTKYLTGRDRLPRHHGILSGYLGDHLIGQRALRTDDRPLDPPALASEIFAKYAAEPCPESDRIEIEHEIARELVRLDGPTEHRKRAFSFYQQVTSVRRCGLFADFRGTPHRSVFADPDVVEFCLRLPADWHIRRRFYDRLFERHFPELAPRRIPRDDRRNAHKPIERWLTGNPEFRSAARELISQPDTPVPGKDGGVTTITSLLDDIVAGTASRNQIHSFFRHLTIEAFLTVYKCDRPAHVLA